MKQTRLNLYVIFLMLQITLQINAADKAQRQPQCTLNPMQFVIIAEIPHCQFGNMLIPIVTAEQAANIKTQDDLEAIRAQQIAEFIALQRTYIVKPDERTSPTRKQ